MRHLGTLSGTGQARIGDELVGPIGYTIRVYRDRNLKDGRGEITAEEPAIHKIFEAGSAILELEGGGSVEILVSHWDVMSGTADIRTSGPIPGY